MDSTGVNCFSKMAYVLRQIIGRLISDKDRIHLYTMNNPCIARKICERIGNIMLKINMSSMSLIVAITTFQCEP